MKMSILKLAVLGSGSALFLGGCISGALTALWQNLPITLLMEWTLDNNSVFDLFADG